MPTIKIDARDNVVVDVSTGMKYAECGIRSGETVIKYGSPIGVATEDIDAGALVHTHNLASVPSRGGSVAFRPYPLPDVRAGGTFSGYRRASGTGIRNDVFIVQAVDAADRRHDELFKSNSPLLRIRLSCVSFSIVSVSVKEISW